MNLFIGSSSSETIPTKYFKDCQNYLEQLFKENNNLIFGAYNYGIMRLSYESASKYNREITSIIPKLYQNDLKELKSTHEIITNDTPERTNALFKESDALIFLPGGIGTIYELFAAIECKRNHEFDKPIIIYNSCHFFDEMLILLDKLYKEKFTKENVKQHYYISTNVSDTLNYIDKYYTNS